MPNSGYGQQLNALKSLITDPYTTVIGYNGYIFQSKSSVIMENCITYSTATHFIAIAATLFFYLMSPVTDENARSRLIRYKWFLLHFHSQFRDEDQLLSRFVGIVQPQQFGMVQVVHQGHLLQFVLPLRRSVAHQFGGERFAGRFFCHFVHHAESSPAQEESILKNEKWKKIRMVNILIDYNCRR